MPNIGLKQFTYGELTTEGNDLAGCVYGTPEKLAGAIECKVSLNIAEATLYDDDVLDEKESVVTNGTITLGINEADDEIFAVLLGSNVKEIKDGAVVEVTSKTTDTAIPIGFGHIVTKIVKHQRKYKVEFFPKVTFKPFMQDAKTKGESLEFTTPSVEGTIFPLKDGTWEKHATFDNETDAVTYLNSLFSGNNE